jgi:hypothetical protein
MAGMPFHRVRAHLTVALAVVAVGGSAACGATGSDEGRGGHAEPAVYPVTIGRSGGIAGLYDTVVVDDSGAVKATTRSGSIMCRIDEETVRDLGKATESVSGTAIATPEHPDDLVVVVTTGRGSARATDDQLGGPMAPVRDLLADLAKAEPDRTLCR